MAVVGEHPIVSERRLEALRHALGAVALEALLAPDVIEIMANPDGRLILDRLGEGRIDTGERLAPEARDRVVRLIADYAGEEVRREDPRVSGTLPQTGERFQGVLPPVPRDAEIAYALSRWISDVRSQSIDPVVIKADWMRAYDLTTPRSAAFLNGWAEAHDPFKDVGRAATSVEVLSVARRSDDSFDVQWRETRFLDGQKAGEERWRALISLKLQPPANEAELMKNPLGIRIEDVSWTPDAA